MPQGFLLTTLQKGRSVLMYNTIVVAGIIIGTLPFGRHTCVYKEPECLAQEANILNILNLQSLNNYTKIGIAVLFFTD